MRFTETANPEQFGNHDECLRLYCLVRNIIDDNGKEDAARLILLLFEGGARTVEDIRAGLQRLNATTNPACHKAVCVVPARPSSSQSGYVWGDEAPRLKAAE